MPSSEMNPVVVMPDAVVVPGVCLSGAESLSEGEGTSCTRARDGLADSPMLPGAQNDAGSGVQGDAECVVAPGGGAEDAPCDAGDSVAKEAATGDAPAPEAAARKKTGYVRKTGKPPVTYDLMDITESCQGRHALFYAQVCAMAEATFGDKENLNEVGHSAWRLHVVAKRMTAEEAEAQQAEEAEAERAHRHAWLRRHRRASRAASRAASQASTPAVTPHPEAGGAFPSVSEAYRGVPGGDAAVTTTNDGMTMPGAAGAGGEQVEEEMPLFVYQDTRPVYGFVLYMYQKKQQCVSVAKIVLQPVLRGYGIGRKLMKLVRQHGAARGATTMGLWSYLDAMGFYKRLGFRAIKAPPSCQHIEMRNHCSQYMEMSIQPHRTPANQKGGKGKKKKKKKKKARRGGRRGGGGW